MAQAVLRRHRLPQTTVQSPRERLHLALLPGDGDGDGGLVADAVRAMVLALGPEVLPPRSGLAELAAFVVSAGAEPQPIHSDRYEPGYLSCQLALHDTPAPAAGGLALWPGSAGNHAVFAPVRHREPRSDTPLLSVLRGAGTVVCYDGRLWHRGDGHSGGEGVPTRRVLYFTARVPVAGETDTEMAASLGEVALHPQLRCFPMIDAPLLRLWALAQNARWVMLYALCSMRYALCSLAGCG